MRIYFIRHAAAQSAEEFEGDDLLRPLTDDGARKAKKAFRGLAKIAKTPEIIITSTAVRAAQTSEILKKAFRGTSIVRSDLLRPGASYLDFLKILEEIPADTGCIAVVGHEPDITHILSALLAGNQESDPIAPPVRMDIKKGACITVEMLGVHGTLLEMMTPSSMRRIGRK